MKIKIFTFLLVAIGLMASTSAFAANDPNVAPGQTTTYSVTSGMSSYTWHVYTFGGTTDAPTSEVSFTTSITNSLTITWLPTSAGKKYTVWVQAKDAAGCLTEPQSMDVTVSTATICIAKAVETINGVSVKEPANTTVCSVLTDKTDGSGIAGDEVKFYATIDNGVPSLNGTSTGYTVTYKVAEGATEVTRVAPGLMGTDPAGKGSLAVNVSSTDADVVALFDGTSASRTLTVTITKVTYNSLDITNACTDKSFNVTVSKKPTIAFQ